MVGIAVDDIEQLVTERGELGQGGPAGLRDPVGAQHHLVHDAVVDGREQLFLRADVVVEGAFPDLVGDAELGDPRSVVPAAGEDTPQTGR